MAWLRGLALALVIPLGGCVSARGFQDAGPGRAYLVESHCYVVTSETRVWNCDATSGVPQCWRVAEKPAWSER